MQISTHIYELQTRITPASNLKNISKDLQTNRVPCPAAWACMYVVFTWCVREGSAHHIQQPITRIRVCQKRKEPFNLVQR